MPKAVPIFIAELQKLRDLSLEQMKYAGAAYKQAEQESTQYYIDYYKQRDPERGVGDMRLHIRLRAEVMAPEAISQWESARRKFIVTTALLHAWDKAPNAEAAEKAVLRLVEVAEQTSDGRATARKDLYESATSDVREHFIAASREVYKHDPLMSYALERDGNSKRATITRRQVALGGLAPLAIGMAGGALAGAVGAPKEKKSEGMAIGLGVGTALGITTIFLEHGVNTGLTHAEMDRIIDGVSTYADRFRQYYLADSQKAAISGMNELQDDYEEWHRDCAQLVKGHAVEGQWQVIEKGMKQLERLRPDMERTYRPEAAHHAMVMHTTLGVMDQALDEIIPAMVRVAKEGDHSEHGHRSGFDILRRKVQEARRGLETMHTSTLPLTALPDRQRAM